MNTWQRDVLRFHEGTGSTVGETIELRDRELRAKLIMEEAVETVMALGFEARVYYDAPKPTIILKDKFEPNLIEVIDGICDSIYVLLGTAVAAGVDIEPFFTEVQRANMAKLAGPKREDGKQMKPADWTPPDHERVLAREQAKLDEWMRLEESWRTQGGEG